MEVIEANPVPAVTFVPSCVSDAHAGVAVLDPMREGGWDSMVARNGDAGIFHTAAWARVLQETYGHRLFYLGRIGHGRLESVLPIMEVSSFITGRRGVSLPFTDFCAALTGQGSQPEELYSAAMQLGRERGWRYLECRSQSRGWPGSSTSLEFWGHEIDLSVPQDAIFNRMESSVRRGVRKAEGAHLKVEFLESEPAMRTFFLLHTKTRKRHGLPPQPFRFFQNIVSHLLEKGLGFIAVARLGRAPVAAAVFFHHGKQAIYKFGASDYAYQSLRPNNLIMWQAMKRLSEMGIKALHLGRTSIGHEGLRRFKLGLGAAEARIQYCKYDFKQSTFITEQDKVEGWFNSVFRVLPSPLLRLAGQTLYPHLS